MEKAHVAARRWYILWCASPNFWAFLHSFVRCRPNFRARLRSFARRRLKNWISVGDRIKVYFVVRSVAPQKYLNT